MARDHEITTKKGRRRGHGTLKNEEKPRKVILFAL